MDKDTKRLTQILGAVGIAAGLGLGAAGLASAATASSPTDAAKPTSSHATASTAETGTDQQDPQLNGSVTVPETKSGDDNAEAAVLQAAAKITPEQAKQAALAALPGTVNLVELDNENGSVVYSVEITANGATTDVKVDAGNAKVLARESDQGDGQYDTGGDKAGNEGADRDQAPTSSGGGSGSSGVAG